MKSFIRNFVLISVLCFAAISIQAKYSIDRLEPPFWWIGMQNNELQLLVYGENISDLKPIISYPDVILKNTITVENPNYLFIILEIGKQAKAGAFEIEFQQKGKTKLSRQFTLREREKDSRWLEGFNNSDAIYLITPDRFANGNPDNDEVEGYSDKLNREDPQGRHGGDLKGIVDHLDYIKQLGFTSIWLNPVLENNMERTSYHGYATTDFYLVDPRYGSNEEYRELGALCKEKGIKLIMDMIMNHCGSEHWWMKDLPSEDWINFKGKYVVTNHRRSTVQDPYVAPSERSLFHDGWFVSAMPDMNQKNPLMAQYLIQNSIWWIEYAQLRGIRHDTHSYPDKDFMSDWSCALMEEYPNFNIVGEEWSPNPATVSYWQQGKINKDGYTSCMPSMMDFPTQLTLAEALNDPEDWNKGFIKMYEMLANDFLYADPYNFVIFPDNHDMSRIYTQVNEDYNLYKMAITYIATMRGIPQFYYGTEILMSNPGTTEHGVIRSDFPGGWEGDITNAFKNEGLTRQQKDAKSYLSGLLNWRKYKECIHDGQLMHYSPQKGVYVYFRYNEEEMVMVVFNKNDNDVNLDVGRFKEVIGEYKTATDLFTDRVYFLDNLTIKARSPLVLDLRK